MNTPKYIMVPNHTLSDPHVPQPMPLIQNQPISITVGPEVLPVPEPVGPQPLPDAPPPPGIPSAKAPQVAGGSYVVHGGGMTDIARWIGSDEETFTIYSTATRAKGPGADQSTMRAHQVWMRVNWGTDKGQRSMDVPSGQRVVVCGTNVTVQGFMKRQDGQPNVPTLASNVQCFIAIGDDGNVYPSWWQPSPNLGTGTEPNVLLSYQASLSALPVTAKTLIATNTTDVEGTLFLYDCEVDAEDSGFSKNNDPIVGYAIVAPGDFVSFDWPRGRQFFNGLLWVVSSTRQTCTVDTAALWRVDAELGVL